jgi:hypothetical protein
MTFTSYPSEPLQHLSHETNIVFAARTPVYQGFQWLICPFLSINVAGPLFDVILISY